MAFVGQRHGLAADDLDRMKRQQYVLSAVFGKMSAGGTLAVAEASAAGLPLALPNSASEPA